MKKKIIQIIIVLAVLLLIASYFWKAFLPNQLDYTINDYFSDFTYHNEETFKIYDTKKWLNGELVAVEEKNMVGVVYLEKTFGIYRVENHILCNKTNVAKSPQIEDLEYQYRLLRAKSFVDGKDVVLAYVKDDEMNSFKMSTGSNEARFELPGKRKVILSEANGLYSSVKIHSEVDFVEWKDEKLQDIMKYNVKDFIYKSDKALSIAVIGESNFKTEDSIRVDNTDLERVDDLSSEDYDAIFINTSISQEKVDALIKNKWNTYIIDPIRNLKHFQNNNLDEDLIVLRKGNGGFGKYSKVDFYDLKTNYFIAYSSIFEFLSERKE